jgi:hypothetical protein
MPRPGSAALKGTKLRLCRLRRFRQCPLIRVGPKAEIGRKMGDATAPCLHGRNFASARQISRREHDQFSGHPGGRGATAVVLSGANERAARS